MDTTTLVPAGGLAVVIVTLVGYLLRQLVVDRQYSTAAISGEQARTRAAEVRTVAAERRADRFQKDLDLEREKRRDAETAAASASTELLAQRRLLEHYQHEVRRMSAYQPGAAPGPARADPPGVPGAL